MEGTFDLIKWVSKCKLTEMCGLCLWNVHSLWLTDFMLGSLPWAKWVLIVPKMRQISFNIQGRNSLHNCCVYVRETQLLNLKEYKNSVMNNRCPSTFREVKWNHNRYFSISPCRSSPSTDVTPYMLISKSSVPFFLAQTGNSGWYRGGSFATTTKNKNKFILRALAFPRNFP